MFGFSLAKLVVLVVAVVLVLQAFKQFGRLASVPRQKKKAAAPGPDRIETVECQVCGTYVSTPADGCGRKDCPYG